MSGASRLLVAVWNCGFALLFWLYVAAPLGGTLAGACLGGGLLIVLTGQMSWRVYLAALAGAGLGYISQSVMNWSSS